MTPLEEYDDARRLLIKAQLGLGDAQRQLEQAQKLADEKWQALESWKAEQSKTTA